MPPRPSPLSWLRVPPRLASVALATVWSQLELYGGRLLLGPWPRRRQLWPHRVFRTWCRLLAHILGLRLEIHGRPPEPPFLLVANHVSYVDILALGAATGGVFVAKREIDSWPVMGHLCRSVGTVFLDRTAKRDLVRAKRQIEDALADGRGIVLFPEATTGDGLRLLPFRPSLLEVAAADDLPVHWATVRYTTPPDLPAARDVVAWHDDTPIRVHLLRLLRLRRYAVRVELGGEPVRDGDRKRLTERLRQAMEEALTRS